MNISIDEYDLSLLLFANCITYDNTLYNIFHDKKVKVGDELHLIVEDEKLFCDILIEDIEYGDGTIWYRVIKHNYN